MVALVVALGVDWDSSHVGRELIDAQVIGGCIAKGKQRHAVIGAAKRRGARISPDAGISALGG